MSLIDNIVKTYSILNGYPVPESKLQLAEKEVVVTKEPSAQEKSLKKLWDTAEKVGCVLIAVIENPLIQKLFKGVVNRVIDSAELGAMEKAVEVLGDKVLPGDVAAVKLAFTLITGLSAIAKQ